MNATSFLAELDVLHVTLTAEGADLRWHAPPGTMTPALLERMKGAKSELLHLLRVREMQSELLVIAGSLGLPDALVFELPGSELEACCEQVTWMQDAEAAHKLLAFYLRSLAGEEAALPGSTAAKLAPSRQTHVRELRQKESKS